MIVLLTAFWVTYQVGRSRYSGRPADAVGQFVRYMFIFFISLASDTLALEGKPVESGLGAYPIANPEVQAVAE